MDDNSLLLLLAGCFMKGCGSKMGDATGEVDTFGDECPFLPYKTDMFKSPERFPSTRKDE